MFVRNFLPRYAQPDVDLIENLSVPIIVDQKRLGGGSHSTVGTITDIYTVLRLLFSKIGQPYVGNYNVFSFNDQGGHKGGQILFEGTPKDLLNVETSYTAQYLRSEHQPI